MPKISKRGIELPSSPIRKLVPFAEAAKKKGRKVYHLNIGQPDIKTPEIALEAVKNINERTIEYSHSAGNESYRKALAKYYQNLGFDIDHTNVMITTGGSEAITFSFLCCLDPGDEVIIPEPFYTNYVSFAQIAGVVIKTVPSSIEDGFAMPPIELWEEKITDKTKAIVIINPGNPTGYSFSEKELTDLSLLIKKYDLYLLADEVYREFCYDGLKHYSVLKLENIKNNVIVVDSVSKRYSACGARIGALVSYNKELLNVALKFAQARLSPPSLGQILGEAALQTPASYFEEVYNEYIERRNYFINALNKIEGVLAPMPKGAFYSIVRLPVDDSDKFCQWMLEEFHYENETVMMAPASGFYATKGRGRDEVRIAYVLKIEDLKRAIICLTEALKVYPGRTV